MLPFTMKSSALYLRSVVLALMTVSSPPWGSLQGSALAGCRSETIILAGIVYMLVESFSMAMGDFVSEESAEVCKQVPCQQ